MTFWAFRRVFPHVLFALYRLCWGGGTDVVNKGISVVRDLYATRQSERKIRGESARCIIIICGQKLPPPSSLHWPGSDDGRWTHHLAHPLKRNKTNKRNTASLYCHVSISVYVCADADPLSLVFYICILFCVLKIFIIVTITTSSLLYKADGLKRRFLVELLICYWFIISTSSPICGV